MSTGRAIRDVPYLTTARMVEVDRVMIEEYGIELIQMMENAGRNLAHLARTRFPARQLRTLVRLGVLVTAGMAPADSSAPDLLLDGVIGYSLSGAARGTAADLIRWARRAGRSDLGARYPIGARHHERRGLRAGHSRDRDDDADPAQGGTARPAAAAHVGELYLADIGVPPALYAGPGLGLSVGPVFARAEVLRLR